MHQLFSTATFNPIAPPIGCDGCQVIEPAPQFLQQARLDKTSALQAVAGYKRLSNALLLLRLPGWDQQARSGKGLAKSNPGAEYGGEAFGDAKKRKAHLLARTHRQRKPEPCDRGLRFGTEQQKMFRLVLCGKPTSCLQDCCLLKVKT